MTKIYMRLLFPSLALLIFISLLGTLLLEWTPGSWQVLVSFACGLFAYSLMLTQVLISVRIKVIEHHIGLPNLYAVHGFMGMAALLAVLIHFLNQWNGFAVIFSGQVSTASLFGFIGAFSLLIVILTGVFVLSNTFIKRSKKLMKRKDTIYKRERQLWLHRLSLLAIVAIYFHLFNLRFVSSNALFMTLLTTYTIVVLGWYAIYKINLMRLPRYSVHSISKPTQSLYQLELIPADNQPVLTYKAGQYAFLRFVDSDVANESHPFSLSSSPEHSKEKLQMIIKESGDFTRTLNQVKPGDKVTLDGPYGDYFPKEAAMSRTPMVLLSGGIGVTPNLSILRHEIANKSDRRIFFVWGLATKEDIMLVEELDRLEKEFPNFTYHFIFSNEEVPGYAHGFISPKYLQEIGAGDLYDEAHYYICGPPPMLNAAKKMLADNHVDPERIFLEEFAF